MFQQATAVLAKIFDLPHDAVLSTPTGEFGQLLGKVYRNLDTLLPALYGSILPVFAETLIGVVFISYAYGVVGLVQGLLFVCYTVAAWFIAKKKADRMQEATKVGGGSKKEVYEGVLGDLEQVDVGGWGKLCLVSHYCYVEKDSVHKRRFPHQSAFVSAMSPEERPLCHRHGSAVSETLCGTKLCENIIRR